MKTRADIAAILGRIPDAPNDLLNMQKAQLLRLLMPPKTTMYQTCHIRCCWEPLSLEKPEQILNEIQAYAEDGELHIELTDIYWVALCGVIVETLFWVMDIQMEVPRENFDQHSKQWFALVKKTIDFQRSLLTR